MFLQLGLNLRGLGVWKLAGQKWLRHFGYNETKIRATVVLPQKEANRVLFMRKLLASRVLRRGGKNIHLKKGGKKQVFGLVF